MRLTNGNERNRVYIISKGDSAYPSFLSARLGLSAPSSLTALGNLDLLALPKTALFCSARCPGSAILAAYDQSAHWRDAGRCIISGFHSPVERECLRILLRGKQPIIICPARALPKRIPPEWRQPFSDGRLLILSAFPDTETRVTAALAHRRNEIVAALGDEAYFAHITPGGSTDLLAKWVAAWNSCPALLESSATTPL
ncbi:MAG: DNA-binding protein [Lentisphaerae bacterium]|nr:DNA-binding protein [Lentisphaerota bacterium]